MVMAVLEVEIPLDPGRYEYKFFVDGQEVVDPANPDKVQMEWVILTRLE